MKWVLVLLVCACVESMTSSPLRRFEVKPGELYLAEQLFPSSYALPMNRAAGGTERAQWLADW